MRVMPGATVTRQAGCALAAACIATTPPKEKPASHSAACGQRCASVRDDRERVVGLAAPLVVAAAARAHAAEVEADRGCAALLERARQRLHHLVVERAAVERMRMTHHPEGAQRLGLPRHGGRRLDERLQTPGRGGERRPLGAGSRRRRRRRQAHQQAIEPLHVLGRISRAGAPSASAAWSYSSCASSLNCASSLTASRYFTSGCSTFSSSTGRAAGGFWPAAARMRRICSAEIVLAEHQAGRRIRQPRADAHLGHPLAEGVLDALQQPLAFLELGVALPAVGLARQPAKLQVAARRVLEALALETLDLAHHPLVDALGKQQHFEAELRQPLDVRDCCAPRRDSRQ